MTCLHPLLAWKNFETTKVKVIGEAKKFFDNGDLTRDENGGLSVSNDASWFNPSEYQGGEFFLADCGECSACRLESAKQWAIRCTHEAKEVGFENCCFLTLTYDNAHLPKNGSLVVRDHQLFLKRLRKRYGNGIRFFMCGEYGDDLLESPHYHYILIGLNFPRRRKDLLKITSYGNLYRSDEVAKLWTFGFNAVTSFSYQAAAYVAAYVMKKIDGEMAQEHYRGRTPEFSCMSQRPGIGSVWIEECLNELDEKDKIILDGRAHLPPQFYDNCLKQMDPASFAEVRLDKIHKFSDYFDHNIERWQKK